MAEIPDIPETEQWIVKTTLRKRHGEDREIPPADTEIRLRPAHRKYTTCPLAVRRSVVHKTAEHRHSGQLFCRPRKQMGASVAEYDGLAECTVSVLPAQTDHVAEEQCDLPTEG